MSLNVYYGDNGVSAVDGNWNNAANWFSSPTPDGVSAGTPLGRVPQNGDIVFLTEAPSGVGAVITTGPIGGWAGPLNVQPNGGAGGTDAAPGIAAGVYSGRVTWNPTTNTSPTISGGTFSGPVFLNNAPSGSNSMVATISGGLFTGTVTRTNPNTDGLVFNGHTAISGGKYAPSVPAFMPLGQQISNAPGATPAVCYQLPATSIQQLPVDPGFAVGGGTFAPVIVVTGVP